MVAVGGVIMKIFSEKRDSLSHIFIITDNWIIHWSLSSLFMRPADQWLMTIRITLWSKFLLRYCSLMSAHSDDVTQDLDWQYTFLQARHGNNFTSVLWSWVCVVMKYSIRNVNVTVSDSMTPAWSALSSGDIIVVLWSQCWDQQLSWQTAMTSNDWSQLLSLSHHLTPAHTHCTRSSQ